MLTMHDRELLREFARSGSEPVFEALVERYVGLVYSAALRQVRDAQHAEDITQAVFILLARKAAILPAGTVLSGWLLKTTRYAASNHIRAAVRRAQREQEAVMQSTLNESDSAIWEKLAPWLDEVIALLGDADRNAIALRYFENRPWREVAGLMHVTEDAAQKRVARALDKLRALFAKRGVTLTAELIAGAVAANSVQAVPPGMVKAISVIAATKGAAVSTSTLTLNLLKIMAWSKANTAIVVGVAAILAVGTTALIVHHKHQPEFPPLPPAQPVTAGETQFPKSAWHFAGYANPESVLMTCMWAMDHGDTRTMLASFSPGERERTKGQQIITPEARQSYAQMTGYRIVDKQVIAEDKVAFVVKTGGQERTAHLLIERIDGEWKYAGMAEK